MSKLPLATPESHPFAVLYRAWAEAPTPNGFDYHVPLKEAAKAWRVAANSNYASDRLLSVIGGCVALAVAEDKPYASVMRMQWEEFRDVLCRAAGTAVIAAGLNGAYDHLESSASQPA